MTDIKTLTIDLETSPNVGDVWSLWNQNIGLTQLRESTRILGFAAKWHDSKKVVWYSEFHNTQEEMLQAAYDLLDEADIVVHYNGKHFDVPHFNREFATVLHLPPPSPFKQVDLLLAVRKVFRFPSNKLDYVSQQFGLKGKVHHEGHTLWVKCLAGDTKAWAKMRTYCKFDVVLTEQLHDEILAWIPGYPNPALYSDDERPTCRCGSINIQKRGFAYTAVSKFDQWRCNNCGSWFRSGKRLRGVDVRSV